MSRMTLLTGAAWLSLGLREDAPAGKSRQDGYPPFDVELLAETAERAETLRLTLAVAGFTREGLDVTVGDGELVVRGRQTEALADTGRDFLYKGIAGRQFRRSFGLAAGIEVCKAELDNGLLVIELRRLRKAEPVRKVGIATGNGA